MIISRLSIRQISGALFLSMRRLRQFLTAGRLPVGVSYGTIIVLIPWMEDSNMKIVIVTGSAHRHGTAATLTD